MKKLFSRCLTAISCVALMIAPVNRTISCGPDFDPEDARFMLYRHEMAPTGLAPFHYTPHYLFNERPDPMGNDVRRNCEEWSKVCGGQVKPKDIYLVLYNTQPEEFLYMYNNNQWVSLADNTFVQWLREAEHKAYMAYMVFTRTVEFDQMGNKDPWEEGIGGPDLVMYDSLANVALRICREPAGLALKAASARVSGFLQERYAFQATKLLYYKQAYLSGDVDARLPESGRNDKPAAIACYETYLKGKSGIVVDWAMLYYALSFKDQGKRINYLLQTFDRCDEKKVFIYNHLSAAEAHEAIAGAADNKMRAVIYAYEALKNPGKALNEIKQVMEYGAGGKYLPMLISREINKLEDWIWSPQQQGFVSSLKESEYNNSRGNRYSSDEPDTTYAYYGQKNFEKDKQYLHEVREYLESALSRKDAPAELLKLAIIHLYHVEGDFANARQYMEGLGHSSNPDYNIQYNIEHAISVMYTMDLKSDAVRDELNDIFVHLEQAGVTLDTASGYNYDYNNRTKDIMSELYLVLSTKLKEAGDIVVSGLVFQKSKTMVDDYHGGGYYSMDDDAERCYSRISWYDKYATEQDIDLLLKFKEKKNKTPFEERFSSSIWPVDDLYKDVKATILIRKGRFEEALAVANTMSDDFWDTHYQYRHHIRRSSVTSVGAFLPLDNGRKEKYPVVSKKTILKDIVGLRTALKNAAPDSVKASLSFMLANCYYNISYYGKDWMMFSYGRSCQEMSDDYYGLGWVYFSFYPNKLKYGKSYYGCADALNMYEQALRYAHHDKELAAQCVLMLSVCDRAMSGYKKHLGYVPGIHNWREEEAKPFYSSYLDVLRKSYSNTIVFQRAKTECPDVEEYLGKQGE